MDPSISSGSQTTPGKRKFFSGPGCWSSLAVVLASLFWFVLACLTPAMLFDIKAYSGFDVLLLGWMGIFLGQFAWFANLFWLLSLLLAGLRQWLLALIAIFLAFLVAMHSFTFFGTEVPLDEAFVNTMIFQSYRIGFYFWLLSFVVVALGSIAVWALEIFQRRGAQRGGLG